MIQTVQIETTYTFNRRNGQSVFHGNRMTSPDSAKPFRSGTSPLALYGYMEGNDYLIAHHSVANQRKKTAEGHHHDLHDDQSDEIIISDVLDWLNQKVSGDTYREPLNPGLN